MTDETNPPEALAPPMVRWGILGTARIAIRDVIPALQATSSARVVAIASRDAGRASLAASRAGIPTAHGTYQALLDDADVDAIYIPLPNHLHVPWSMRALESGKHVLCEKPVGMHALEAQSLLDAARARPGLKVMEAFMYRCHPRWRAARDLVSSGAIGALRSVHTVFSYDNRDPANIRNIAAMGGGALMDIGCYGISVARFLFEREPLRVEGMMQCDPQFGTDSLTSIVMAFGGGTATVTCSTQMARHQQVVAEGTLGRIEIEMPFNAPTDTPTTLALYRDGVLETISFAPCDQYRYQAEMFSRAVLDGADVPVSLEDSIANMKVIDAVRRSTAGNAAEPLL